VIALTKTPRWLLTNQRLLELKIDDGRVPLENSSKTFPLIKLNPDEIILTTLTSSKSVQYGS
jgi:hypothetical protein